MADEIKNFPGEQFDDQTLLDYLSGRLSSSDEHRMEESMLDSEMLNDIIEGLEKIGDAKKLSFIKFELERSLRQTIEKREKRRNKWKIKGLEWPILFTVIILLLLFAAFVVLVF